MVASARHVCYCFTPYRRPPPGWGSVSGASPPPPAATAVSFAGPMTTCHPPASSAILLFLALLLPASASPYACPCSFLVAASHRAPSFDVHLSSSPNSTRPFYAVYANRSAVLPRNRDALFHYHSFHVPVRTRITLRIQPHSTARQFPRHAPLARTPPLFRVSALDVFASRDSCPVLLVQHPPARKQLVTSTPSRLARLRTTRETQERHKARVSERAKSVQPRIVGGRPSGASLASYLVYFSIPKAEGNRACSGTLISPTHVVTAAHCEINSLSTAYIGGRQGTPADGVAIAVAYSNAHPNFFSLPSTSDRRFRFDIAVVKLASPAPDFARFAKVNGNASIPLPRSIVRAAGYGIFQHKGRATNRASRLHQVDIPVVPESRCENNYFSHGLNINYEYQVCAGYLGSGGCDSW